MRPEWRWRRDSRRPTVAPRPGPRERPEDWASVPGALPTWVHDPATSPSTPRSLSAPAEPLPRSCLVRIAAARPPTRAIRYRASPRTVGQPRRGRAVPAPSSPATHDRYLRFARTVPRASRWMCRTAPPQPLQSAVGLVAERADPSRYAAAPPRVECAGRSIPAPAPVSSTAYEC